MHDCTDCGLNITLIMASQVVAENLEVLHINPYIRGYHAYMELWTPWPVRNEILILKHECTNVADGNL